MSKSRISSGIPGFVTGSAVTAYNLIDSIGTNVIYAMILAVGIITIILIISTSSYFEVILFFITIGVSIMINNGTNIIFGEISFITSSASALLQLAIAMDYSIFLLHRFSEERKTAASPAQAMMRAIRHSFSSISASAVTTMVGFLALVFMSFQIGFDMGLVLAKGILISLISVLTLLPALTLISIKLIDKTTHRPFLPSFKRMGKAMAKVRYFMVGLVVVIAALAFLGQSHNTFQYGAANAQATEEDKAEIEMVRNAVRQPERRITAGPEYR